MLFHGVAVDVVGNSCFKKSARVQSIQNNSMRPAMQALLYSFTVMFILGRGGITK
jgi:hypothetical protein